MENQTGTKKNVLRELAGNLNIFIKALVGNDGEFVNDVDDIPSFDKYKRNANDADIQADIENLEKIQREMSKRSSHIKKLGNNGTVRNDGDKSINGKNIKKAEKEKE